MTVVEGRVDWRTEDVEELDPISVWQAARSLGLEAALWLRPAEGIAIVGIGRAWSIEPSGPDRFAQADRAWQEVISGAAEHGHAPGIHGPILLGGLGFTGIAPARDDLWAPFGPSSLVVPELTYAQTDSRVTVTSVRVDREAATGWSAVGRRASEIAARQRSADRPALVVTGSRPDRAAWDRLVGLFAGAVGRGRLDKVVLARRLDVEAVDGRRLDVVAALRHLASTAPESTTYAFSRGESTFLGATPERLVRTEGGAFQTVALAGSAPRSADPDEDARLGAGLLASEKDREEHGVVVAMLRQSLTPLVDELVIDPSPRLLALRHVQHLMTPVAGRLREDVGLLSLAGLLHPTPAVGGEPRDLALELIAEHEGFDRGWYAGPVGWVDRHGDGELVVALRCGFVVGSRAALFAGCGIVADSDARREWDESRVKLRAVADALGGIAEEGD